MTSEETLRKYPDEYFPAGLPDVGCWYNSRQDVFCLSHHPADRREGVSYVEYCTYEELVEANNRK